MKKVPQTAPSAAHWSTNKGYVRMMIRDLATEVRLGLHPWERHPEKPQRIVVNVELYAAPPRKITGRSSIVDYDYIRDALKKWPRRRHTVFIETLLDELVKLCFKDKRVEACRVSIFKPDIYNEAAGAGVEVYRVRQ
ncbi:MAG TPA: dihydroneopterin aldolase [Rhizomicrobium sp.]|nr:dihydroneopterin aldolase [Rhizomicrobium sp.]